MDYTPTTHSFDPETLQLLGEIAKIEAEHEKPNESKTLRKMIREKAERLGIKVKDLSKKTSNKN